MQNTLTQTLKIITPIDGSLYYETPYADEKQINQALIQAKSARRYWASLSLEQRISYCQKFLTVFKQKEQNIAKEICWQMGRPQKQAVGEVTGVIERAEYMIACAKHALADVTIPNKPGVTRFIRKYPVGTVFVIAPWNFPFLTAINTIIPALLAGNTVILKHASQTAKCAEIFFDCFQQAGLPEGVFQYLHLTHNDATHLLHSNDIHFVALTGSVSAGKKIKSTLSQRFIGSSFELGGKDAAYVRHDANLDHAVENLLDGAMFNSGQSCCGIERIYVAQKLYVSFVEKFVDLAKQYQLGDPTQLRTTLGPVVTTKAARKIRAQIQQAVTEGASALIDASLFSKADPNSCYLAPQVLVNCDQTSNFMQEETFGPVVGILPVNSDEQAMQYINDSPYGLTGSVWTEDIERAIELGEQAEVGTWFMNRCDYLDPALAWTGVKETGYGVSLSELGYRQLTQVKSYHLIRKSLNVA